MIKMNRKILAGFFAVFSAAVFVTPVSAKRAKNEPQDDSALVQLNSEENKTDSDASKTAEESSAEESSSKKSKKAKKAEADAAEKEKAASEKEARKKNEKAVKASKVKVVDSVPDEGVFQAKTIENTVGRIKYLMKGTVGSFQMYAIGSNGSQTPLLAGYDEFTSSFMSLLVEKKEYKLTDNIGIVIGARKNDLGAQLVYIVPDVARVFVKFERVDHSDKINSEIIKVTSVIYNKSKKNQVYQLKSVLDTVLGEQFGPHFITAEEPAVNNERQFRNFAKVKWIESKNNRTGMQFLFNGGDITAPEAVSLGNKDFLALKDWIPSVSATRTFDSVLSYQNSAICINWPSVQLKPEENHAFTYYIAVSTDGQNPDGDKFIEELDKKLKKSGADEKYSIKEFEDGVNKASELYAKGMYQEAYKIVLAMWENPDNRNVRLATLREMIEQKLGIELSQEVLDAKNGKVLPKADTESKEKAAAVKKYVVDPNTITKAQLDPEYVQALIDRINSMSEEDDIDREEILKLNAELDAILEKLRMN